MVRRIHKIELALILLEQFASLKEMCFKRKSCIGCPYMVDKACTLISTDKVIQAVGDAAREYLFASGVYPIDHEAFEKALDEIVR